MGRDLFVVLRMLHRSGIDAGVLATRDELFVVWLKEPWGGIVDAGYFRLEEVTQASDWLVAHALHHFPRSDFAKTMAVLAQASAAVSKNAGQ